MIKPSNFNGLNIGLNYIVGCLERVLKGTLFFTHNNKIRKIFVFALVVCGFGLVYFVFCINALLIKKEISIL